MKRPNSETRKRLKNMYGIIEAARARADKKHPFVIFTKGLDACAKCRKTWKEHK